MEIPLDKDITYFGRTNFRSTDRLFGIKRKDRRQHMYVLGKSGTGKSSLLSNLIIQDIMRGEGCAVVDPHGELVEEILGMIPKERMSDVIYFNPADAEYNIGFNILELIDKKYKHLVASGLMGIFTKLWAGTWSARMEYILNNAILALLDTPGSTLLGIPRLLVDKDYRQVIIGNVTDPVVRAFWIHEYEAWQQNFRNEAIAPIQNKVGQFLSTALIRNVVGQKKSTIDIFEIMNKGKIFLVNVSKGRIGEDNSELLGSMLITKIQLAAMERVRVAEKDRRDFYLYVDEFQNFVTNSFAGILSEARKYRLALTLAHQYIDQLVTNESSVVRDAVFGNVGTMIVFRVGAQDAEFLKAEFEPEFEEQDFVMLPNFFVYLKLMVDGVTTRPFSAKTLPPFHVATSTERAEKLIRASRENYARPRVTVEEEINQWSGMIEGVAENDPSKFKVDCSVCNKTTFVPFEPKEGLPVYCRECLAKVKTGEIPPVPAQFTKPKYERSKDYEALAALGIEFQERERRGPQDQKPLKESRFSTSKRHQQKATQKEARDMPERKGPILDTPEGSTRTYRKESSTTSGPHEKKHYVPPPRKERKPTPHDETSKESFREILREAIAETLPSYNIPANKNVSSHIASKSGTQKQTASLSSLKNLAQEPIKETSTPPVHEVSRAASNESKSMLKSALADVKDSTLGDTENVATQTPSEESQEKRKEKSDTDESGTRKPDTRSPKEIPEDVLKSVLE